MNRFATMNLLLAILFSATLSVFIDQNKADGLNLVNTQDLNFEDVSDDSMTDEQKALLWKNFVSMNSKSLEEGQMLTPDMHSPGDVTGIALNKNQNIRQRTPNVNFIANDAVQRRVHVINEPKLVTRPDVRIVNQDIAGSKQVRLTEPKLLMPKIVDEHSYAKQAELGRADQYQMPTLQMPEMNSSLPDIDVSMPSKAMPSIQVGEMNKDLESLQVDPIESRDIESITVPKFGKKLDTIELPEMDKIAMPDISLPDMNATMADFTVPTGDASMESLNVPKFANDMADFTVGRVEDAEFADFHVPSFDGAIEDFTVPKSQSEEMTDVIEDIKLPQVHEVAGPKMSVYEFDDKPHHLENISVQNVAHDIHMPQVDSPSFSPLATINVQAPEIQQYNFAEMGQIQEPTLHMPSAGIQVPLREPQHIAFEGHTVQDPHQVLIPDHVIYSPTILLSEESRYRAPHVVREPTNRYQTFQFPIHHQIAEEDQKTYHFTYPDVVMTGNDEPEQIETIINRNDYNIQPQEVHFADNSGVELVDGIHGSSDLIFNAEIMPEIDELVMEEAPVEEVSEESAEEAIEEVAAPVEEAIEEAPVEEEAVDLDDIFDTENMPVFELDSLDLEESAEEEAPVEEAIEEVVIEEVAAPVEEAIEEEAIEEVAAPVEEAIQEEAPVEEAVEEAFPLENISVISPEDLIFNLPEDVIEEIMNAQPVSQEVEEEALEVLEEAPVEEEAAAPVMEEEAIEEAAPVMEEAPVEEDVLDNIAEVEEPVAEEDSSDFVYDLSNMTQKPNEVASVPNTYQGDSYIWIKGPDGNPIPFKVSGQNIDGTYVGDSK